MYDTDVSRRSYTIDIIVLIAMFTVACAIATALILEAKIPPVIAASFAAVAYLAAVMAHMLLRKTYRDTHLQAGLAVTGDGNEVKRHEPPQPSEAASFADVGPLGPALQNVKTSFQPDKAQPAQEGLARLQIKSPSTPRGAPIPSGKKEHIDRIIRRLADAIASGRKAQHGVSVACVSTSTQPPAPTVPQHEHGNEDSEAPETSQVPKTGQMADPEPSQISATDKLAAVAEALQREELDVFLEPIHGLDDGHPRHFEVSIRLKLGDDDAVGMNDYSEAARGTSWLPLIDVVKVSQAKKVALYLLRRGESGAFLSQIDGESVAAGKSFSDDLAMVMGHDRLMAGRLVLSITQDDVRGFSPAQWGTITRLRQLGFRFAIAEVNSLDMDFEMLAERGFAFAKLDASIFLEGLPAAQTLIPPTDVCRYLAGSGLTLVVNGLSDNEQKAKVLGFGAIYGQGVLFGAPRPVKTEALESENKTTASSDLDRQSTWLEA